MMPTIDLFHPRGGVPLGVLAAGVGACGWVVGGGMSLAGGPADAFYRVMRAGGGLAATGVTVSVVTEGVGYAARRVQEVRQ